MESILPGGRGPAVEDVQRRLLVLGYDLGPTGVDGVFLGRTREAVIAFQKSHGLAEDGVVGGETWATLVDETFTLGDRMLYLRLPYFHGRDVRFLQTALNTLGFPVGDADGIFGPYSERAVREFQRNCGLADDGIVGPDTVRAIDGLRHVWEGKDSRVPSTASVAPVRAAEALSRHAIEIRAEGSIAELVADRLSNLAFAANKDARICLPGGPALERQATLTLVLTEELPAAGHGVPVVEMGGDEPSGLVGRFITALSALDADRPTLYVDLGPSEDSDEIECQRRAVRLLDALCAALASGVATW